MLKINPPLRDGQEQEGSDRRRPLLKPPGAYTLEEVKEYCEGWEECPQGPDCEFYRYCAIWPYDWKFKQRSDGHGNESFF